MNFQNFQRSESRLSYYYLLPRWVEPEQVAVLKQHLGGEAPCCESNDVLSFTQKDEEEADRCKVGNFHFFVCSKCSHLPVFSFKRHFVFHNFVISESSYLTHNIYLWDHEDFLLCRERKGNIVDCDLQLGFESMRVGKEGIERLFLFSLFNWSLS